MRSITPVPACLWIAALATAGVVAPVRSQELTPGLKTKLERWYRSAHRTAPGTWGIAVADQEGQILWSVNPDEALIPASTVKLLTTGYARSVLGSDARRATRVVGYGRLDEDDGRWIGRWALQLNGDPTLESPTGSGPKLLDLANQLAAQGIRHLQGPLQVLSGNGQPAEAHFPRVWRTANWGSIYAPLVGSLTLHENMVMLYVQPGSRPGARARLVETSPSGLDALVNVHATTVPGRRSRLRINRMADGGYLVTGAVGTGAGTRRLTSVAADPKAVLAAAWARALQQAGIEWDRTPPVINVENDPSEVLAEVTSAPFDSLAYEINRRSLNIGAELLLRWAAAGSDSAPELLTEHVEQVAGVAGGVKLVDGSGMSHEDRVTPATFIYYMANVQNTPAGRNFPYLLPANGVGTLARLASGLPGQGVVRAKTGTLSGVSTLVGYLGRRDGVFIVSLMYNGPRAHAAKRQEWQAFRLLGAEGVTIPPDEPSDDGPETERLGGDSTGR
ncbi:MAG TPA: D-alanyl-D-alanine carboxypeptidase/D-alanyl-D-alanine-endopeptidase [Gemmatimonadales bacterium]|nr:D-alanyl-D-alanine carboxypeptidase/D-alanyl-D-alanine-endopeptidase [Gemmatimonadales bacterium]